MQMSSYATSGLRMAQLTKYLAFKLCYEAGFGTQIGKEGGSKCGSSWVVAEVGRVGVRQGDPLRSFLAFG